VGRPARLRGAGVGLLLAHHHAARLFLLLFLGYPFIYGVYLSFFHKEVAREATFVGFGNFVKLYNDPIFWQSVRNTIIFTGVATILKASGGLGMALVMNQSFKMKAFTRAALLLPFIVPTVLSTVAWQWIFDPGMGLFNRLLVVSGLAKTGPSWLGNPTLAMVSIIMVNTWRGLPFFGISILAGSRPFPRISTSRPPSTARARGGASAT
jgi:multiple sugar transport system permease protein